MQIEALRYFMAVAKTGSIAAASKQLQVAGSAISRQIANLEEEFDCILFDRLPRGMVLSDAGELLSEQASAMLHHVDLAVSEIQSLKGVHAGRLRIAASREFVQQLLSYVIADYGRRFPNVRIDLRVADHREIASWVENMEREIGIVVSSSEYEMVRAVYRTGEELVALSSIIDDFSVDGALSADDLWKCPLALTPVGSPARDIIDRAAISADKIPNVVFCSNEITAILAFMRVNRCVAVIPKLFLDEAPIGNHLIALKVGSGIYNSLHSQVLINRERAISPAANEFLSSLLVWLASQPSRS